MNTPEDHSGDQEQPPSVSEHSQASSDPTPNNTPDPEHTSSDPAAENITTEPAPQEGNSAEAPADDPEHHHLAAATSPAEILTSELLKVELVAPIPTPEQTTAPVQETTRQTVTEPPLLQTETQATAPTESKLISEPPSQPASPIASDPTEETTFPPSPSASAPEEPELEQTPSVPTVPDSEPETATPSSKEAKEASAAPGTTVPPTRSTLQAVKAFIMRPSVLMILSAFLFSTMILFVKLASDYYTSFEIISARGFIGALCILIFQQAKLGLKKGALSLKTQYLPMQAWRAFIGTMSMMCWFYGVSKLSLALATTLSYMSSIWIAIFIISTAFITGTTRPSAKLVFSILLGFGGIILILRPSGADIDMFAAAVVVISSVFGALAYLQVAALGRIGEPAFRTVFYFSLFGVFFGLIITLTTQGRFSDFSLLGIAWLVLIGILAMLAQFCLTLAYTGGNALVNASLQYSGLIFVIIFDWVLGTGWPDYFAWLGMALVVISGLLATFIRSRQ